MRYGLLMAAVALAPMLGVQAAMPASANNWHVCKTDADCVVVPGICGEAAVNPTYKNEAAAYYKEQARSTKCPNIFWKPQTGKTRCRLEACEIAM